MRRHTIAFAAVAGAVFFFGCNQTPGSQATGESEFSDPTYVAEGGEIKGDAVPPAVAEVSGSGFAARSLAVPADVPDVTYEITMKTGDRDWAETDAKVYLKINGSVVNGVATKSVLYSSLDNPGNDRQRNQVDNYYVTGPDVGSMDNILLGHDNTGWFPGWYVDWVVITKKRQGAVLEKRTYSFNRWLAKDQNDKLLYAYSVGQL